jgi:hypothetical protein
MDSKFQDKGLVHQDTSRPRDLQDLQIDTKGIEQERINHLVKTQNGENLAKLNDVLGKDSRAAFWIENDSVKQRGLDLIPPASAAVIIERVEGSIVIEVRQKVAADNFQGHDYITVDSKTGDVTYVNRSKSTVSESGERQVFSNGGGPSATPLEGAKSVKSALALIGR